MFTSVVVISGFTAGIASALTVGNLDSAVRGPEDLPEVLVGTVAGSTGQAYLATRNIRHQSYESAEDAIVALLDMEVEALVYDAPILRYLAHHDHRGRFQVVPRTFLAQDYAIGLSEGSPLREPLNRVLLELLGSPRFREIENRYLGVSER